MKKLNLIFGLFAILFSSIVSATFLYSILAPSSGTTLTNRAVNYSFLVNVTDFNPTLLDKGYDISIYRNGSIIFGPVNYTNATFFNKTINNVNGVYSWYVNTTNGSNYLVSSTLNYIVAEPANTYKFGLLAPNAIGETYNTLSSTSVNFSFTMNATGGFLNSTEQLNCNLYNRSSSTGNYSILFSNNITNSTFFNRTVDLKDDTRYWYYVNCSTAFNPNYGVSSVKLFDIDVEEALKMTFGLGVINFSTVTGNATFKGVVEASSFIGNNTNFNTQYDARTDRFGLANYSTEYTSTGFDNENFTTRYDARTDRFVKENLTNLGNVNINISGSLNVSNNAYFGGNVGIGTTEPTTALQTIGKGNFSAGIIVGTTNIDDTGSIRLTTGAFQGFNGSDWINLGNASQTAMSGWTDDGTIVRLSTETDNVGIGTISPSEKLTIMGNVNISGYLNISGDLIVNKQFNISALTGNVNIAGILDATNLKVLGNIVQVEKDSFKLNNYSAEYASTGFDNENFTSRYDARTDRFVNANYTTLAPSPGDLQNVSAVYNKNNFTTDYDARTDRFGNTNYSNLRPFDLGNYSAEYANTGFKIGNYSTEYANTGYKLANFTSNLNSINASISLWNISGSNIYPRNTEVSVGINITEPTEKLVVVGNANITGNTYTGMLRQKNTWYMYGGLNNTPVTIALVQGGWTHITNASTSANGSLLNTSGMYGLTLFNDTITFTSGGDYFGSITLSMGGGSADNFYVRVYNLERDMQMGYSIGFTTVGSNTYIPVNLPLYIEANAGDRLQLQVSNPDNNDDISVRGGAFFITYLHE